MTDISLCAKYAKHVSRGIIASALRRKKGVRGIELMRWLAIPLELSKRHGARLVPCMLLLVDESHSLPREAMPSIAAVLKGIASFDEDSLDDLLEIDAIRKVVSTRAELRALAVQIADAIKHPDEALLSAALDWSDAQTN